MVVYDYETEQMFYYKSYFQDGDVFYCFDNINKTAAIYQNGTWSAYPYETHPKGKELNREKTLEALGPTNLPIHYFHELAAKREEKYEAKMEALIAHDDLEVIGWVNGEDAFEWFQGIPRGQQMRYDAALVKDIRAHHYSLSGRDYEFSSLVPVFSDFTALDISSRHLCALLAIAHFHDYRADAYNLFMLNKAAKGEEMYYGFYDNIKILTLEHVVEEDLYNEILEHGDVPYDLLSEGNYLYPVEEEVPPCTFVELHVTSSLGALKCLPYVPFQLTREQFEQLLFDRSDDECNTFLRYNEKRVDEAFKKHEAVTFIYLIINHD